MMQSVRAIVVKDNQLLVMSRNKFGKCYYTLIGGGIDPGESAEEALFREIYEETGIAAAKPRLVYIEEPGKPYGTQYIYTCEYISGEPQLRNDSIEAELNKQKLNIYKPMWIDIDQLPEVPFLSENLKNKLIYDLKHGFPDKIQSF